MESYSEQIGKFAGDLKLADVPPAVVEKAKLVFLDTLGVALASSTMDFGCDGYQSCYETRRRRR